MWFLSSSIKGLTFVWVVLIASSITTAKRNAVNLNSLYNIFETIAQPILHSIQIEVSEEEDTQDSEHKLEIEPQVKNISFVPNKHMRNEVLGTESEPQVKNISFLPNKHMRNEVLGTEDSKPQVKNISFVPNKHMSNEKLVTDDSEETVILAIPSSPEIQPSRKKGDSNVTGDSNVRDHFISKYKQLQHNIENLLNKESISDKTKYLLTNAFAKAINQLNRPCMRKNRSEDSSTKLNRRLLNKLDKAARRTMLKSWKHRFNQLIDRYREEDGNEMLNSKENFNFLAKLRNFFFEMHNDFQNLTRRHDLNCYVVSLKKPGRSKNSDTTIKHASTDSTLNKDKINEKKPAPCQITKICRYELKLFLTDFYTDITAKVDLVFHNYKKMYLVDLSKETSNERRIFMRVLDDVKKQVKKKYNETIAKEKAKISIDSSADVNTQVENIKAIIDKTILKVKVLIDLALTEQVRKLSSKIQSAVKSDIRTNADIELSEVQNKYKAKMCTSFETCYGKDRRKKLSLLEAKK